MITKGWQALACPTLVVMAFRTPVRVAWRDGVAQATILHADLDAFYASVEQLLDPSLRGRPIAVGGGVVLAASYEAKAFGVPRGMPGWQARQLCPGLRFVGGHFREYQRLADQVIDVLRDFTPLVERISIDEAFLDVTGSVHLFGPPAVIGAAIRRRVRDEIGLPDLRGCGPHQAPGQGRLPGGQAGRAGGRRRRAGAGLPRPATGRAHLGRRPGDPGAAGRQRHPHHRRAGRHRRTPTSSTCSARRSATSSAPCRQTATRAGRARPQRASVGAQAALGPREATPSWCAPRWPTSPTGWPAGCGPAGWPGGRSPPGCASRAAFGHPLEDVAGRGLEHLHP